MGLKTLAIPERGIGQKEGVEFLEYVWTRSLTTETKC
jgi:hypothetical protein